MPQWRYVLVTPARNEQESIGRTIEAVIGQTIKPLRWVIVSDGSVDQTAETVQEFAESHDFIDLVVIPPRAKGDFGSKVRAFHAGLDRLTHLDYEFVGNLDADVTFNADYYESMLGHFERTPRLGVAAGAILERVGNQYVPQCGASNSAAGSVQLFRRRCYESFGGYVPIKGGGIDAAAEIMARMHGWEVRTFPETPVYHHRRMSTGGRTILNTRFRSGVTNYTLGYHPLFQLATCAKRVTDRPYLIGSICSLLGYSWAWLKRSDHAIPTEAVRFLRSEQLERLTGR